MVGGIGRRRDGRRPKARAPVLEPITTCVLGWVARLATPASRTVSRIAPENCSRKCRSTLPSRPARPKESVPEEAIWIEAPSGLMMRVQITKARDWALRRRALILTNHSAAARDQDRRAVESAHVPADHRAGEPRQIGIQRSFHHAGDQDALGYGLARVADDGGARAFGLCGGHTLGELLIGVESGCASAAPAPQFRPPRPSWRIRRLLRQTAPPVGSRPDGGRTFSLNPPPGPAPCGRGRRCRWRRCLGWRRAGEAITGTGGGVSPVRTVSRRRGRRRRRAARRRFGGGDVRRRRRWRQDLRSVGPPGEGGGVLGRVPLRTHDDEGEEAQPHCAADDEAESAPAPRWRPPQGAGRRKRIVGRGRLVRSGDVDREDRPGAASCSSRRCSRL